MLKNKIVGSCTLCGGSGKNGLDNCSCIIKFSAYNRMISGGFRENILDFVNNESYTIPYCVSGRNFLDFYTQNISFVMKEGLCLYICSADRGRGKTTLSHYIVYKICELLSQTYLYQRNREYRFEHIADIINKSKYNDTFDWKSTVLVIDDLGNEDRSSSWKKENVISLLQQIMQYRRDYSLPTIITSNYNPSALSRLYDGVMDSLLEIKVDGTLGGSIFRQIELDSEEDLRLNPIAAKWPEL